MATDDFFRAPEFDTNARKSLISLQWPKESALQNSFQRQPPETTLPNTSGGGG